MAEENFLVQWEDRFMSVIKRKQIVSPVKDGYMEGDLIRAIFEKKVYEAVICEMHPNKRHLLQQAKLPPKFEYVKAKKQQSDTAVWPNQPSSQQKRQTQPDTVDWTEPDNQVVVLSDEELLTNERSSQVDQHLNNPINLASRMPNAEAAGYPIENSPTSESQSQSAVSVQKPDGCTVSRETNALLTGSSSPQTTQMLPIQAGVLPCKTDKTCDLVCNDNKYKPSGWEEEGSILRKKIKRLDSRITALEAVLKNGNPKSEDEYALDLVKHLDNEQDVVSSLAKHIFTEDELINHSRTGKKTVKCSASPRPPLDQRKLERLQRLALQKTGMKKDLFIKKFENLQKVLRRSKKDMRKMSEAGSSKI